MAVEIQNKILISKSDLKDVDEHLAKPLTDVLFDAFQDAIATVGPNKPWVIDYSRRESLLFGQVEPFTRKLAGSYLKQGLTKNDVVTIISDNRSMYYIPVFAAWLCGAAVNLLDPWVHHSRLEEQFRMLPSDIVVCIPEVLNKVEACLKATGQESIVLLFENKGSEFPENHLKRDSVEKLISIEKSHERALPSQDTSKNSLAMIFWSSGSTGKPKAIKIANKTFINAIVGKFHMIYLYNYDYSHLVSKPWIMGTWMFHYGGFGNPLAQILNGGSLIYLQPDKITSQEILQTISEYNCELGIFSYHDVIKLSNYAKPTNEITRSLKLITPVGAQLPVECRDRLYQLFPNLELCPDLYGSTEMGGVFTALSQNAGGNLYPGVKVKICDLKSGEKCKPNQEGEICVQTPRMTLGYLGISNEEVFDHEGFFKTGDIGYYDSKGLLFYTDRLKDLIKVGLHHVYPAEVESIMQEHPSVVAAGVVGIQDPERGEVCAAAVTLAPCSHISEEELIDWTNSRVQEENWKCLGKVVFVDKLPLNSTGKKVRKDIKNMFL